MDSDNKNSNPGSIVGIVIFMLIICGYAVWLAHKQHVARMNHEAPAVVR